MLNKVPEVTVFFWIIKILATTVGETAADYLNLTLGFGLQGTSIVMAIALAVTLYYQFRADHYVAWLYWLAVVLISIVGTLITDNLTDGIGVPLIVSTTVFSALLTVTFIVWYVHEKTLSIHSIHTRKREGFYWLAILFTFALGTAFGDLIAEKFALGYPLSLALFVGLFAVVAIAHLGFKLDAVLAFWLAYILTRPLGASLGDLLSQSRHDGGLGVGTTATTAAFLLTIAALVAYLTVTKRDVHREPAMADPLVVDRDAVREG
ncbi:COG4705 family protein [Mycobacterium sp.]|uniref:COG4705 family protein n=1 Tax=Mycobacterium sp. TaxID=1785 RepID=UPI003D6C2426